MIKSSVARKAASAAEVTNMSAHGIWLLAQGREYFLSYDDFPWFKNATVSKILDVTLLNTQHLFWPQLDVDLEINSLDTIENYPLVYHK